MSALKSHSPDHMVVEALDTRMDMDIKTNAGGGGGIFNIAGKNTVIGNKVNSIFSKLQGPHLNFAY